VDGASNFTATVWEAAYRATEYRVIEGSASFIKNLGIHDYNDHGDSQHATEIPKNLIDLFDTQSIQTILITILRNFKEKKE
jgi:hypothetical protein